jgi:hypothetical protein
MTNWSSRGKIRCNTQKKKGWISFRPDNDSTYNALSSTNRPTAASVEENNKKRHRRSAESCGHMTPSLLATSGSTSPLHKRRGNLGTDPYTGHSRVQLPLVEQARLVGPSPALQTGQQNFTSSNSATNYYWHTITVECWTSDRLIVAPHDIFSAACYLRSRVAPTFSELQVYEHSVDKN